MAFIRLLLVVVVVLVIGAFLMGYFGGQRSAGVPQRVDSSDTVAQARARGAEIGEKAGAATARAEETLNEAALTTKIKAKMALDDSVKASAINVTTHGTTVTLSGTVRSQGERDRAMSLARETEGVTQVIDDLHTS